MNFSRPSFLTSVIYTPKCVVVLSKRACETDSGGQREPRGGIHATSWREICTDEWGVNDRTTSAHLRDGGADKNAGDDDVKSRAGDALRGVAGDGECDERSARRVRDGGDADESAPRPPIPARHHHGVLLEKSAFVCEWICD